MYSQSVCTGCSRRAILCTVLTCVTCEFVYLDVYVWFVVIFYTLNCMNISLKIPLIISNMLAVNHSFNQPTSGIMVACLTALWEDPRLNLTAAVVFITIVTAIYSVGHGLHTLTAVPRSTQPSTLRGTVKWVSALGLSNNKMAMVWMVAAISFWRTCSLSRLAGLGVGGHLGTESAFIKWTG